MQSMMFDICCVVLGINSNFQRDWLRRDLNVIGFGLIGWLAPSSIPAIDGKSLTGLFFESIGTELAHFPSPPPLTSQFWSVALFFFFWFLLSNLLFAKHDLPYSNLGSLFYIMVRALPFTNQMLKFSFFSIFVQK